MSGQHGLFFNSLLKIKDTKIIFNNLLKTQDKTANLYENLSIFFGAIWILTTITWIAPTNAKNNKKY